MSYNGIRITRPTDDSTPDKSTHEQLDLRTSRPSDKSTYGQLDLRMNARYNAYQPRIQEYICTGGGMHRYLSEATRKHPISMAEWRDSALARGRGEYEGGCAPSFVEEIF